LGFFGVAHFLPTFLPTFSIIDTFQLLRSLKDYGEHAFLSETYFGQDSVNASNDGLVEYFKRLLCLQSLQGCLISGFPVDAAAGVFNQLFGFQAIQPGIGRAFRV
jgi:hypothetical protein